MKAQPLDALLDPWLFYNKECTSFAAWRLNQQGGRTFAPWSFLNNMEGPNGVAVHFGNAYQWRAAAVNGGWRVDNVPAVGAVAYWGPGEGGASTSGHVAIVYAVNGDGTVNVEEYNWATRGGFGTRTNVRATSYLHLADPRTRSDVNGDGKSDFVICRAPEGKWYVKAGPAGASFISYGVAHGGHPGDVPMLADVNGDGKSDFVIYRAPEGKWYVKAGPAGASFISYGVALGGHPGDVPIG